MNQIWFNDGINPVPSFEEREQMAVEEARVDALVFGPAAAARMSRELGKSASFDDPFMAAARKRLFTGLVTETLGGEVEVHPLSHVAILASLDSIDLK